MDAKKLVAEKAVESITDGMIVGLGTGSTAFWAIQKIGERVKSGLTIGAVATSQQSEKLAREVGIPILSFEQVPRIDVAIDGADEIDRKGNLIKGGGGALLREKIIASNSKKFIVIADSSKAVDTLGKFLLPVEIFPFASELTLRRLRAIAKEVKLRQSNAKPFITDNGNLIADCNFFPIEEPQSLDLQLKGIAGVAETGLFLYSMVSTIIIGSTNGELKIVEPQK